MTEERETNFRPSSGDKNPKLMHALHKSVERSNAKDPDADKRLKAAEERSKLLESSNPTDAIVVVGVVGEVNI